MIEVIEAQNALVQMKISDYPTMNKNARKKLHQEMFKMARPSFLRKRVSIEDAILRINNG